MKRILLGTTVLVVLWGVGLAGELMLKPEVTLAPGFVRLSDLVVDADKADIYRGVFLGRVPKDSSRELSLAYIVKYMRSPGGFAAANPRVLGGGEVITVHPIGKGPVTEQQKVEALTAPPPSTNPRYGLHHYVALKATQKRGTPLQPEMVELSEEKRFVEDAFTSIEDIIGYRLDRTLPKGSILTRRQVSPTPVIERGTTVKIIIKAPGIQISGVAKTIGEGKVGDTIEVRRQRETLKGTILDPHTVLIQ